MKMRHGSNPRVHRRAGEAGYTLLLVVFLVATMIIAAAIATPNIITQGRRQKEDELIWRGNQYVRAIRMYNRKFNNKFPTKIEDLTNQTNGVRFLRQAYKDPMNKEDGSWRFIFVGPNGTLIGSNRQVSLLQGAVPGQGSAGGAPLGGLMGQLMSGAQNPSCAGTGAPGVPVQTSGGSSPGDCSSTGSQPLGGSVMGGNIIGVGSKVDKSSLRVYLGESNYKNWEFIWNPLSGLAPGQPPGNGAATAPPGGSPQAPPPAQ
jgi:type II secretory pathway pseudopilin PulG